MAGRGATSSQFELRPLRRYTDIDGIAAYLSISVRHVRRLVLERRIPHRKIGSRLRFDIDEVDDWMNSLRRGPDPTTWARRPPRRQV